jgi:Cu/Ag efflux pump CusA
MALAIMGGLTVATVLTIFFVPALYAAWFKVHREGRPPIRLPVTPCLPRD